MEGGSIARLVRGYIERVVNQRDLAAVDELVSSDYRGSGPEWPSDIDALRQFYAEQYRDRPNWRIDVQETIELGGAVVVRATAGGDVLVDGVRITKRLEWLTLYRIVDGMIREIQVLAVVQRGQG